MHWMNTYFDSLSPSTERQRQLLISARDLAKKFAETQMLMARQLSNPFPPLVLVVVVCWASALFLGNGLVTTPNVVTVCAHLAGAIAIASAIFLILELSSPYTGLIRLSPAGLDRLLQVLDPAEAKNIAQASATRGALATAILKTRNGSRSAQCGGRGKPTKTSKTIVATPNIVVRQASRVAQSM